MMIEFQNALIALQVILRSAGIFVGAEVRHGRDIHDGLGGGHAVGENSGSLLVGEDLTRARNAVDSPEAEIRHEEERFVLPDRPAQVGIEIVEIEWRSWNSRLVRDEVVGVQNRVAEDFRSRSEERRVGKERRSRWSPY